MQLWELVLGGTNHSGSCKFLTAAGILRPHLRTIASAHTLAEGLCQAISTHSASLASPRPVGPPRRTGWLSPGTLDSKGVAEFLSPVLCQAKCFIYLIVKTGIVADAGFTVCFPRWNSQ